MQAELNRLENNASQQLQGRLELDKEKAANDYSLKDKDLELKAEKNRIDEKYKDKDIVIKDKLVALEREQLLYGDGDSKEIKNRF
jgi:LAS superfamily LD-carboxypeptidase LdcB